MIRQSLSNCPAHDYYGRPMISAASRSLGRSRYARRRTSGMALVITLAMLAIVLILIVGFTMSMRTERMASNSMANNTRTILLTKGALAHAVSILQSHIPSPAVPLIDPPPNSATNWIINPGRLTLIDSANTPTVIDLHSGAATSDKDTESYNLNKPLPGSTTPAISPGGEPMRVKWLPVLQDPSLPASATNVITGRYAFWIDDECAKINFNTASGKPADTATLVATQLSPRIARPIGATTINYILGHPASVNLDVLGTINPQLYRDVYTRGFLNTPEAIRNSAYVTDPDDFYTKNRFWLTPYSRSPEFNVFGKSRIFLMELPDLLSRGGPYQHQSDNTQPMYFIETGTYNPYSGYTLPLSNRDSIKPLLQRLAGYFTRTDWPGFAGKSFVARWQAETPSTVPSPASAALAEADQVALNLTAMGNLVTSYMGTSGDNETDETISIRNSVAAFNHQKSTANPAHEPDRDIWYGILSGEPMLPQVPVPLINEVSLVITPQAVPGFPNRYYLRYFFRTELYHHPDGISVNGTQGFPLGVMAVRPTHVEYTAAPSMSGTTIAQNFNINSSTSSSKGWRFTPLNEFVALPTGNLQPDSYVTIDSPSCYVGSYLDNGYQRPVTTTSRATVFTGSPTLSFWVRMGTATYTSYFSADLNGRAFQLVPIYSPEAPAGNKLYRDKNDGGCLRFDVTIPLAPDGSSAGQATVQSHEVDDPRVHIRATDWKRLPTGSESWGGENESVSAGKDLSKLRYWNMNAPNSKGNGFEDNQLQYSARYPYRATSIGMLSFISTGIQRSIPWQTLKLQPAGGADIPDWLAFDLFAPAIIQNQTSIASTKEGTPISYMNSTAGKININSKIYPDNPYFAPAPRMAPLQALFKYMPDEANAVAGILQYQNSGKYFQYAGEVCEAPNVATIGATAYEKEANYRHLANLITTQSNTFGIWGIVQTVKKNKANTGYGAYEAKDTVTGEKRFYAVVERYVWPGRDGIPGNAHINASGAYDRMAAGRTAPQDAAPWQGTWAAIDGPDSPQLPSPEWGTYPANPSTSTNPLEAADNPLRALMKYRVLYFKYLDE